ncbi:MAG: peptidylprolyl isomerase, partial [Gammaproteobacteria bacterium]|nr:peptidylprolyl isomerase [Gammaproteobacteria bacterium]
MNKFKIILISLFSQVVYAANPTVCMNTISGNFCIELFQDTNPNTVANFLTYLDSGAYNNMVFHRSIDSFVIQGGGYTINNNQGALDLTQITKNNSVANEVYYSNTRGTVAMAKVGGDPDSASSEWFINMADNSA